ncbi:hypothetical protein BUALT_Bualt05G0166600 [Buddleja alternifolia]|uniref:F-box domain-containing protein n=1 Tax=Buddleja alternifolia TaxID=168488 RepID=A0AAV6XT48_9LAMI|nr:hypothetical protein BUALT_Bualt05G0166600 [Buddleja alternifolia]
MALNCSHRPVFPARLSEDNLVSPMRIMNGYLVEGGSEKNGEGYLRSWHESRGETDLWNFNGSWDRIHNSSSPESCSEDVVDLLPPDPFGMHIKTTLTAITGWLEDLEVDYGGNMRNNNCRASQEDYDIFGERNLIWSYALKFQPSPCNVKNMGVQSFPGNLHIPEKIDEKLNVANKVNQIGEERDLGGVFSPYDYEFQPPCNSGDVVGFREWSTSSCSEMQFDEKEDSVCKSDGVPHEAFIFALSYLGVKDLLSVERVCRSLCSTVRDDPLLWMSIHIDQPLNERITDDVLVQLACRAQGNLQCLSLVECPKITDDGIGRILETNPRLTKLCVPGCTRLSIEGVLNNIKTCHSKKDVMDIKCLRIGGLYGVTHEHFDELKLLLGTDNNKLESHQKPHFYHRGNFYLPHDDDRAIDIEMCPRCEKFKLVYDCPAEGCRVKDNNASQACRACTLCIPRCAQCGTCINDNEYEEMFCLELLCSDCVKQLGKYQDRLDKKVDPCEGINEASYQTRE